MSFYNFLEIQRPGSPRFYHGLSFHPAIMSQQPRVSFRSYVTSLSSSIILQNVKDLSRVTQMYVTAYPVSFKCMSQHIEFGQRYSGVFSAIESVEKAYYKSIYRPGCAGWFASC